MILTILLRFTVTIILAFIVHTGLCTVHVARCEPTQDELAQQCKLAYSPRLDIGIGGLQGHLLICRRDDDPAARSFVPSGTCSDDSLFVIRIDWTVRSSRVWSIEF